MISASVDDRTRAERGLEGEGRTIPKSRYDSIDSFLSACCNKWPGYNDLEVRSPTACLIVSSNATNLALEQGATPCHTQVLYDPKIYQQLVEGGVDHLMAQHVAHLFIR